MSAILTPSATRALLERLGLRPNRRLGQNFLVDGNIVRKSLQLADVRPGSVVVEIGPGLGTLTHALLEAGAEVFAVEFDRGLHAYLAAEVAPHWPGRLHLVHADAVDLPLAGLPAHAAPTAQVVANLPYAISSPWLAGVLAGPLPASLTLMLQREAADRIGATHGSKDFGPLAVLAQAAYEPADRHVVQPACFFPRPEVTSVLLHLRRRAAPVQFAPEAAALLRDVFQQRRKQLGARLRERAAAGGLDAAALEALGVRPELRAEQVPVPVWIALAAAWRSSAT